LHKRETPLAFKVPTNLSKPKWSKGLSTLNGLWKRGIQPEELERHYFLHWFVVYKGNIIQTAKALQIHRNTIQGHFLDLGYSKKSVRLRHAWQKLNDQSKNLSFEKKFDRFYKTFGKKPSLSPAENAGLVGLWQTLFPFKTLTPHYFLWAVRAGKSKDWVQKELGYSYRHRARLMNPLLKPKTRDGFWLSPLKPQVPEVYSSRYRTILARKKKR
jgi:hypothetical protein